MLWFSTTSEGYLKEGNETTAPGSSWGVSLATDPRSIVGQPRQLSRLGLANTGTRIGAGVATDFAFFRPWYSIASSYAVEVRQQNLNRLARAADRLVIDSTAT